MSAAKLARLMSRSCLLVIITLFFSENLSYPQATPTKETATNVPVSLSTDAVNVDFVVRGKKKIALQLKPEDLVVTDSGTVVRLSALQLVNGKSDRSHLITLLFDPLDPASATNARDITQKILKLFPSTGFSFSVFSTGTRLHLFQDYTADRQQLQRAVIAATGAGSSFDGSASPSEDAVIAALQSRNDAASPYEQSVRRSLLASLTESRRMAQNQNMPSNLAGLLALVRAQAPVAGRKLLVYFTDGLPSGVEGIQDTVRTIAAAATRSEVSIYVVNKSALDTKMMQSLMAASAISGMASAGRANSMAAGPQNALQAGLAAQRPTVVSGGMLSQIDNQITRVQIEGRNGNKDPLATLATGTGGAFLYSEDNLKRPFKQAISDLTTYYEASYIPPAHEYDGTFRPITVKPLPKGLKVQARAGYFAVPPAATVTPLEASLIRLLAGQLPTDVSFRQAVLQLGTMITGNENTLVVEVPVSSLNTHSDANTNLLSWQASIASQIKDSSGTVVEHFSEDIRGHSALDSKDDRSTFVTMQRHFALPAGEYTLETAVLDRSNGKAGGQRTSFRVSNGSAGPFLSDVALVRRLDSLSDESDPLEPLRYANNKVLAGLTEQISPETKQQSFFFLVHSDSSIPEPAMLEMQVMRNGRLFGQVPLQLPKNIQESFPYVASLNAGSLPPGKYDVTLTLTQGDKLMERGTTFRIPGRELASASTTGKPAGITAEANTEIASTQTDSEVIATRRQPLAITVLPSGLVAKPSDTDLDTMIAGARERALSYAAKLPNFVCVEITDRSVDTSGTGKWRRKDSFAELLRYVDKQETRTTLAVNGERSSIKRADMEQWPISLGEFGSLLNMVFDPKSNADFHWKETAGLGDGTVQVFEYRVPRQNNSMLLRSNDKRVYAGFHGLAYLDSATKGIRRITMEADDIPPDFSIHFASVSVDYDYVSIGGHEYLMPMRGSIRLKRGRRETDLNQVVFQDYRRYASQAKITFAK